MILGDRPFAEVGAPALAVRGAGLLAVAGSYDHDHGTAPVAVYDMGTLKCRALLRARHPVCAMAFHPGLPLLAVGGGRYDGGYFFEGELRLLDLRTGEAASLFEHPLGRQVLSLEWPDAQHLRLVLAPQDDWEDEAAWTEGHVATVFRPDWRSMPPEPVDGEVDGPRVAAPRVDGRACARHELDRLSTAWDRRRNVRAIEVLPDGNIVATLDRVQKECWSPGGEKLWTAPGGGSAGPRGERSRLRIRRGRRIYRREAGADEPRGSWLAAAELDEEPSRFRRILPYSWDAGEAHFGGPGVETDDGDLVYAGTVYHGRGPQPGGSFVVRRDLATGRPRWVFRTDRPATDLDAGCGTVFVGYDDGEIVALGLGDGTVSWRRGLVVAGIPAVPTALTVTGHGRLLVGTSDGRILDYEAPGSGTTSGVR
ncbi:hypothetical protein [Actinoplanes sp. NPDC051411]|uniref:hypothetical protein n=1 Tax=Actinoplanes sp. NPDC051411 TaxID=3155522 RepID=UPI003444286B